MKLSDYVVEFMADQGIRHVFLLPGGGCMHLVDSVGRSDRVQFICNLHEQACAIAADAYAQYSGNLGLCLVTTGPGGTNAITGLAAAWLDSTPSVFLSGQVKCADLKANLGVRQMGFQEIDIVRIVGPLTKYAITVLEPREIRYHLEKAVALARSGRPGPVWIDIPLDVQATEIDPASLPGFDPRELPAASPLDQIARLVRRAIGLLNESERPVLLLGNGARLAGAADSFLRLAEELRLPVLTTWKALDLVDEEHPLYVGRPGAVGQRGANFVQQNADWLLTIGARLDFGQTGYNRRAFARAARKVIVDIDQAEIDKLGLKVDVPLAADARQVADELWRQRAHIRPLDRTAWLDRCRAWKQRYPVVLPEYWKAADGISNYVLVDVLSDEMSAEDLLVPGSSGACSEVTMQTFRVKRGMRVLNSQGLGSMGFGIAAPLGACLASGGRRTISLDGDGGFPMNIQELETVRRLGLPIKFFVLNNNGYASIRSTQRSYFQGRLVASDPSSGLTLPDTVKVAEAFGIPAFRVGDHESLRTVIRQVLATPGPVVCDVLITPSQVTAPRLSSSQRPDGTMVSRPLEDMWPFLDRTEFAANMLIPPLEESL
jgi:acetolactate synthase-1/2/3 large subunit